MTTKDYVLVGVALALTFQIREEMESWLNRRKLRREIVKGLYGKDGNLEEEYNEFVDKVKEVSFCVKKEDLNGYSEERLRKTYELMCYFRINRCINQIAEDFKKKYQKEEG